MPHVFRFFVAGAHDAGDRVALAPDDRRHAERVLRLRVGESVEVADAAGRVFRARVAAGGQVALEEVLDDATGSSGPAVWLALAGGRSDTAVEKLTELGARTIGALVAAQGRGVPRLDRWRRVAEAAARQSKRAALPELAGPAPLADVLGEPGAILLDHEAEDAVPFAGGPTSTILVGPEAGWTEAERALARAAGVPLARLGRGPVLRTETAAVAAAALAAFGTLRG